MAFEALVHAATEERKKLSVGSPQDLAPPPVSPLFHRSTPRHHDPDHSLPSSYIRLSRPPYEEDYYHQGHGRPERLRDDELREHHMQEHRRRLELQELDRQRLLEQQRIEKERLLGQQMLVEKMERQREQHRLQDEHEQRRREQQLEEQQRRRLHEDRLRLELERQRREEIELAEERRALEEANQRRLEERRRFEEEQRRRVEERRIYEERLAAEERRRQELLRTEEARQREERLSEELKRREEEQRRVVEEQRRREEEFRRDEHFRRVEQERLLHARARVEHEQRPSLAHAYPDKPLSDSHHFPLSPSSARPLVPRSPPAVIPQSHHFPLPSPHKFEPSQIQHSANHDTQFSISSDGEPPLKRQKYSESPVGVSSISISGSHIHVLMQPSTRHVYPTIVALPPPISDDQSSYRHGPSTVRRPGSGQGKRLGLNDTIEREKDKEKERDRPIDGHRIISPLGRRSPPGSQIGRATAAKKSDEARRADEAAAAAAMADVLKTEDVHAPVKMVDDIVHSSTSPSHPEPTKTSEEQFPIEFETKAHNSLSSRPRDDVSNKMSLDTVMNDQADVHVKKEPLPTASLDFLPQSKEQSKGPTPGYVVRLPLYTAPLIPVRRLPSEGDPNRSTSSPSLNSNKPVAHTSPHPQETSEARNIGVSLAHQPERDDVHEWLLDHCTKTPPSSQLPLKPSRSKSPSLGSVATKSQVERKSPAPLLEVPKPIIAFRSVSPDADAALERELAELMAEEDEVAPVHKQEPDDMDIDLAVAETLEDDKSKISAMEVDGTDDGADEVENELLSLVDDRPTSSITSGRKAAATTPPATLKPPSVKTSIEEGERLSPTLTTSPSIRPPSTRPGSDRESMPPPSAAVQREKDEEVTRKGDVNTTSAQAAKKKKDAGSKVSAAFYLVDRNQINNITRCQRNPSRRIQQQLMAKQSRATSNRKLKLLRERKGKELT
jgi:COMPASS component SPP1